jgi:hypothetical protein
MPPCALPAGAILSLASLQKGFIQDWRRSNAADKDFGACLCLGLLAAKK